MKKINNKLIIMMFCVFIALSTFGQTPPVLYMDTTGKSGIFIDDRDGSVYRYVKIGIQIWIAENLNLGTRTSHHRIKVEFMGVILQWWGGIIMDSIIPLGLHQKKKVRL